MYICYVLMLRACSPALTAMVHLVGALRYCCIYYVERRKSLTHSAAYSYNRLILLLLQHAKKLNSYTILSQSL
jgi:hypothetical protein